VLCYRCLTKLALCDYFNERQKSKVYSAAIAVDGTGWGCLFPLVPTDLTLYSRAMCSWCMDAKDYLSERGYQFTVIDVGRDRDAYEEMAEISAQTYVPTLVAGDEVLANFDTDQLEKFLNEHGIEP